MSPEIVKDLKEIAPKRFVYGNLMGEIHTAAIDERIDIKPHIKTPEDFHGDTNVNHVVRFGGSFTGLIGEYDGAYGLWNEDIRRDHNITILEYSNNQAVLLMQHIHALAQRFILNNKHYENVPLCKDYFQMVKTGYEMLHRSSFMNNETNMPHVSLERAGLVTTRLSLGIDRNAQIANEVRVVTKRTQLTDEQDTDLTVTVTWRNTDQLHELIHDKEIILADTVNPATGASGLGFIIAANELGIKPSVVHHRSISLTQQGVLFTSQALARMGIQSTFSSVGVCSNLTDHYYLAGDRSVADAGHILRHFLPEWYQQ